MTQTTGRFFDELGKLLTDAAGAADGVRKEVDSVVRPQAERVLRDLDVVQREEFEAVKAMAQKAREENELLKARIAALEAKGKGKKACDDDPAPPQDVIAHAAELLGLPVPPAIPFEEAEMTPMARSFYAESKRVSNRRLKEELGVTLAYPGYRDGLRAVLESED